MTRFETFSGRHTIHAAWIVSTLVGILTVLSLLGLLPWATRAEVTALKQDLNARLERMEEKLDLLLLERRGP